jgi:hypothetical protein
MRRNTTHPKSQKVFASFFKKKAFLYFANAAR